MPTDKGGVYQRGGFWLDLDRGAQGKPTSSRWYIWWYDAATGHQRRKSTRETDVRLACDKLDEHYLSYHKPTSSDQDGYSVPQALVDYWLEHGSKQSSAEAIKSRLKLLTRFLDAQVEAGLLNDPILPDNLDDTILNRFRAWAVSDPIITMKKDGAGNWIPGSSRARAPSTAEESIIMLKAALAHAFTKRRVRYVPPLKHKTRDQVTPERTYRLSIDGIAEILDYSLNGAGNYAGHADRLMPLRRYLIASICTLGRPDALLDMSVATDRGQWMRDERRFALNPVGRIQTKKLRPVLPVIDLLDSWLRATDEWFVVREGVLFDEDKQIDFAQQIRVASIKSAWNGVKVEFGIPDGWGPKLMRHSMATILANRRVDLIELEMALGHRVLRKTSSRYAIFNPEYLSTVSAGIEDVVGDLLKKVGPALHPNVTRKHGTVVPSRA